MPATTTKNDRLKTFTELQSPGGIEDWPRAGAQFLKHCRCPRRCRWNFRRQTLTRTARVASKGREAGVPMRTAPARLLMHSDLYLSTRENATLRAMDTLATVGGSPSTAPTAKHSLCGSVSTVAAKLAHSLASTRLLSALSGALEVDPTPSARCLGVGTAFRPPICTTHHAFFSVICSAGSPRGQIQQVPSSAPTRSAPTPEALPACAHGNRRAQAFRQ